MYHYPYIIDRLQTTIRNNLEENKHPSTKKMQISPILTDIMTTCERTGISFKWRLTWTRRAVKGSWGVAVVAVSISALAICEYSSALRSAGTPVGHTCTTTQHMESAVQTLGGASRDSGLQKIKPLPHIIFDERKHWISEVLRTARGQSI